MTMNMTGIHQCDAQLAKFNILELLRATTRDGDERPGLDNNGEARAGI
jgi:hypothetical protein